MQDELYSKDKIKIHVSRILGRCIYADSAKRHKFNGWDSCLLGQMYSLLSNSGQTLQQFSTKVLILGTGEEAQKLAGELANSKPPGYEVKGFIGHEHEIGKRVL